MIPLSFFIYLLALISTVIAQGWHLDGAYILVNEELDPIVSPNAQSSHMHKVIGGSSFGASYNYDSAVQSKCSSLEVQADKSNYWMPSLYWYDKAISKYVPIPSSPRFYYFFATNSPAEPITPFPDGLRILAGSPNNKVATQAATFVCMVSQSDSTQNPHLDSFNFDTDCPYGMKTEVFFPECWDGKNLWIPDGSHMSYPAEGNVRTGSCPLSHPVRLPHIQLEYTWAISNYAPGEALNGNLFWSNGDSTGYGVHADFVNGWDHDVLAAALNSSECNVAAGSGDAIGITGCPILAASADINTAKICQPDLGVLTEATGNADLVPIANLPGCNAPWGSVGNKPTCQVQPAALDIRGFTGTDGSYVIDDKLRRDLQLPTTPGWQQIACMKKITLTNYTDTIDTTLTQESCQLSCARSGYSYAAMGLNGGTTAFHCACGSGLDYSQPIQPGMCTTPCPGNSSQTCGNSYVYSIWYAPPGTVTDLQQTTLSNNATRLGCYQQNGVLAGGLLSQATYMFSSASLTTNMCLEACGDLNSTWAATQGGLNCYCGTNYYLGSGSFTSDSVCSMGCNGNKSEICGAASYVSTVYNLTGSNVRSNASYHVPGYQGCYDQGSSHLGLNGSYWLSTKLTQAMCVNGCSELGYKWAGLTAGVNCYCGNSFTAGKLLPTSQCDKNCYGNTTTQCGGQYNVDLYSTSQAAVTMQTQQDKRPVGYLGCFVDSGSTTTLTNYSYTSTGMTVELCKNACLSFKYDYAGVENSNTCKCGSGPPSTPQVAADVYCTKACAGNSTETCGYSGYLEAYNVSVATVIKASNTTGGTNSTSSNSTSIPTNSSSSADLGCYSNQTPGLSAFTFQLANMTASTCRTSCAELGYAMSGVAGGTTCYCGASWTGGQQLPISSCLTLCPGDSSQRCGGSSSISLYATVGATAVAYHPAGWLGCYSDSTNRTLAAYSYSSVPMTNHACQVACNLAGYSLSGTEGSVCYCDNAMASIATRQPAALCSTYCSGNSTESCGGNFKIDIYNATGAAANNGVNGYLGCYSDYGTVSSWYFSSDFMSVDICERACTAKSYKYAGLRSGNICYCGNTAPAKVIPSTTCANPCTGNPAQNCGTGYALATYDLSVANSPTDFLIQPNATGYVGCYQEGSTRVLPAYTFSSVSMNNPLCRSNCAALGYTYAGTEYGQQCWCASALNSTSGGYRISDGQCSTKCAGGTDLCGSGNKLSIYLAASSSSSNSSSSSSTSSSTPKEGYKGCFNAGTLRTAGPLTYFDVAMTPTLCRRTCRIQGFPLAGITNGNTCSCANSANDYSTPAAPYLCSAACSGSANETCGSTYYAQYDMYDSVGSLSSIPAGYPPNYVGCMADSNPRRLSNYTINNAGMTSSLCQRICNTQGYSVYGTEAGLQCMCGATFPLAGLTADSACSTDCAGVASEKCGGSSRLSLFSADIASAANTSLTTSSAAPALSSTASQSVIVNATSNAFSLNATATSTAISQKPTSTDFSMNATLALPSRSLQSSSASYTVVSSVPSSASSMSAPKSVNAASSATVSSSTSAFSTSSIRSTTSSLTLSSVSTVVPSVIASSAVSQSTTMSSSSNLSSSASSSARPTSLSTMTSITFDPSTSTASVGQASASVGATLSTSKSATGSSSSAHSGDVSGASSSTYNVASSFTSDAASSFTSDAASSFSSAYSIASTSTPGGPSGTILTPSSVTTLDINTSTTVISSASVLPSNTKSALPSAVASSSSSFTATATSTPTSLTTSSTSASSSSASPSAPVISDSAYIGCYTASSALTPMTHVNMTCSSLSPKMCRVWCNANSYTYSGMTDGNYCGCSNDISALTTAPVTSCDTACIGDAGEVCGGSDGFSVWKSTFSSGGVKRFRSRAESDRSGRGR